VPPYPVQQTLRDNPTSSGLSQEYYARFRSTFNASSCDNFACLGSVVRLALYTPSWTLWVAIVELPRKLPAAAIGCGAGKCIDSLLRDGARGCKDKHEARNATVRAKLPLLLGSGGSLVYSYPSRHKLPFLHHLPPSRTGNHSTHPRFNRWPYGP
jgi:hypothetical protein